MCLLKDIIIGFKIFLYLVPVETFLCFCSDWWNWAGMLCFLTYLSWLYICCWVLVLFIVLLALHPRAVGHTSHL